MDPDSFIINSDKYGGVYLECPECPRYHKVSANIRLRKLTEIATKHICEGKQ
jgi:hypothetical protein